MRDDKEREVGGSRWSSVSRPPISVVMSIYNGEGYLREAVESILNQTFTDFEFIIVDDGSTDDTWVILTEYAAQDTRIVLIRNEKNIGLTRSLNKGLASAHGEYVARQDVDDVSLPARLIKQLDTLELSQGDVCFCGAHILQTVDGVKREWRTRSTDWNLVRWRALFENSFGMHSAVMFRRDRIIALGGYDEQFTRAQDYELWDRCLAHRLNFVYFDEHLIRYRWHDASISLRNLSEQEDNARAVSLRALRRLLPYSTDDELSWIRWLFLQRERQPMGCPEAGLRHCRGLLAQFRCRHLQDEITPGIWRNIADSLSYRLAALSHTSEWSLALVLILEALLRSRSVRGIASALRQAARGIRT